MPRILLKIHLIYLIINLRFLESSKDAKIYFSIK